ncbi:hypothetical protein FOPG_18392 [Fusarium oxysporum f. sp. conglutinans race 2 54008]|uniref:Uncharacterized protein n=1 Tax=Fusarium oxysporum f. sp. conglutinans race 2 54008 TaxID=1089457 RepID=X0GZY6_FUSOX|nr:hypothetical protein FOPG_18392 [Fusarium oxysporum f. sp. conglutinans race 2 54008]
MFSSIKAQETALHLSKHVQAGYEKFVKRHISFKPLKYIGWFMRAFVTKSASSAIIEFTRPQDANKIIDEGLIWQGGVFQYELYDRSCRLRQCFACQVYGEIGTQCKATTRCGYCAQ